MGTDLEFFGWEVVCGDFLKVAEISEPKYYKREVEAERRYKIVFAG